MILSQMLNGLLMVFQATSLEAALLERISPHLKRMVEDEVVLGVGVVGVMDSEVDVMGFVVGVMGFVVGVVGFVVGVVVEMLGVAVAVAVVDLVARAVVVVSTSFKDRRRSLTRKPHCYTTLFHAN